ncbi:MAG: ADP-ribosylglycohydrolase family protein [Candidatus Lokiarchaeota archaeon]|nr:ADP-ribosylglycohydrolase family protein [Candidatus Lokiarchaeota archaeon]
MVDKDFLLQKIWGSWTGKISGGTFGMPVEGRTRGTIINLHPPLSGWSTHHRQGVNDDEQYELISILALEALSDDEFANKLKAGTILDPEYLGSYWLKHLLPQYVFTAEKAAYDNAKAGVPWEHAGDYIYEHDGKVFGNEYADWIGAQMKGELYGMLLPAWGWYEKSKDDLELLKPCLDLSLQDALIAHRDVGIVGELFISAMISVAIVHNPNEYKEEINFPKSEVNKLELDPSSPKGFKRVSEKFDGFKSQVNQIGICSETIINDIKRIKAVLLEYASVINSISTKDVELFYSFIDPIINTYIDDPDPRDLSKYFYSKDTKDWLKTLDGLWWQFERDMGTDAISRFKNYPKILIRRIHSFSKSKAVHTLFNNGAIVMGLLYGDGDFIQTVRISTECGADTDCNAGNAGAIIGAYLGQNLIPSYAKRFIRGEIIPGLKEWADKSIFSLSQRTFTQALRFEELRK